MQDDMSLSLVQSFLRNKWVRLFLVLDAILLIIFILTLIWQATEVSVINFNITPLDSTISINGNDDYGNGQYSITPGTYEIVISHEGLETKTFTIDLPPNNIVSISTFLSDKDKTFDYYKLRKNLESFNSLEDIASLNNNITTDHDTSAEDFIQKFKSNQELLSSKLPIDYYESEGDGENRSLLKNITIKAAHDCNLTLCVRALVVGTDNEDFIKNLLREKGINPEDYEIEYKFY